MPLCLSQGQRERSTQALPFKEEYARVREGVVFEDMIAFLIQESAQTYIMIRKRHMDEYSSMWFELSNKIDNMKFIQNSNLPRISANNEISSSVLALTALVDKQTQQEVVFAVTYNKNLFVLNQITFPRPPNVKQFYSRIWSPYENVPYHKQYLLPTSCKVTKLKSGQKVLAVFCKKSLKVYRRIHLGQNM